MSASLSDPEFVEREMDLLRRMANPSPGLDLELVQRVLESREQFEQGVTGRVRRSMWLADQTPALLARIRELEASAGHASGSARGGQA